MKFFGVVDAIFFSAFFDKAALRNYNHVEFISLRRDAFELEKILGGTDFDGVDICRC